MKRSIKIALLLALTVVLVTVVAMAAPAAPGAYNAAGTNVSQEFYGEGKAEELSPIVSQKEDIDAETTNVDFYPNAVQEKIVLTGTFTAEDQYLLLVCSGTAGAPTEDNIVYIDQAAAEADKVTFTAYPSALSKEHYRIFIVGNDSAYAADTPLAAFDYYVPYTLGDVNDDTKINSTDALWCLQAATESRTLDATQTLAADVNKDTKVNSTDALWILQYATESRTSFAS